MFSKYKKKVSNENTDSEPISTEFYQVLCYRAGLTIHDFEIMTIGMCLDYVQEFIDHNNSKGSRKRKATQKDFDSF
jgi:hypothetical protein